MILQSRGKPRLANTLRKKLETGVDHAELETSYT